MSGERFEFLPEGMTPVERDVTALSLVAMRMEEMARQLQQNAGLIRAVIAELEGTAERGTEPQEPPR